MSYGSLFVISTPIGNLKDITYRAVETLSQVDIIICEDTRITRRLLDNYNIKSKMITYNNYNEIKKVSSISKLLEDGLNLALVSDAGTPCISDPGYRLISYIKKNIPTIPVISIPGPSAGISALSISGLPSDTFLFIGFLPKKKGRKKKIKELVEYQGSAIIYESPNRISKTLNELFDILGNRKVFIAREMTKVFEEGYYLDLKTCLNCEIEFKQKGEYVLIVAKDGY